VTNKLPSYRFLFDQEPRSTFNGRHVYKSRAVGVFISLKQGVDLPVELIIVSARIF
jgi:hypothetical protein